MKIDNYKELHNALKAGVDDYLKKKGFWFTGLAGFWHGHTGQKRAKDLKEELSKIPEDSKYTDAQQQQLFNLLAGVFSSSSSGLKDCIAEQLIQGVSREQSSKVFDVVEPSWAGSRANERNKVAIIQDFCTEQLAQSMRSANKL